MKVSLILAALSAVSVGVVACGKPQGPARPIPTQTIVLTGDTAHESEEIHELGSRIEAEQAKALHGEPATAIEVVLTSADLPSEERAAPAPEASPGPTSKQAAPGAPNPNEGDLRYHQAFKNGDMYYMIGHLERSMAEPEYEKFYRIAVWLAKKYFRPIIVPVAQHADLRAAVTGANTTGIIWSSHGATDGSMRDYLGNYLEMDVFSKNAGPRFKHIVISACHGDVIEHAFSWPPGSTIHHWTGETDSGEMYDYLLSSHWDRDLEHDLGIKL